jgi:PAS domain S-box-containing protein
MSKQLDLLRGFGLNEVIEYGISGANSQYEGDSAAIKSRLQQQERAWIVAADTDPLIQNVLNNAMAKELSEFGNRFPSHSELLLTDRYGATVAATRRPSRYSHAEKDWWQAAYAQGQGKVFIGQPVFDPARGEFQVTMAVPVRADPHPDVIGVLRTTLHMQAMLDTLIPFHSENEVGFNLLLPDGTLLDATGIPRKLSEETMARLQAASQAEGYIDLSFEGTLQMLSQARLLSADTDDVEVFQNLDWTVIAHEKPATMFAPLHTAWRSALLAMVIVLFLTSGVAVILAQVLIAPITRLTKVAAQIAAGDLTTQAQIESQDEIGTLANTFNNMLQTILRTQQELRESETLYRSLVDDSPDMIMVHRHGKVLFVNPAGVKLLGADNTDQLVGQSLLEMVPVHVRDFVEAELEQVQESMAPIPALEQKMYRLDGTSFESEFRVIPISYAGEPAIQFVLRDITERKQAEEQIHRLLTELERQKEDLEVRVAERTEELRQLNQRLREELAERQQLMTSLRQSEERFRLLFGASPDAIFLIDPHDEQTIYPIVDCNQAAADMNGYTREELIGQSIDSLNVKKGTRQDFASILQFLRDQGAVHGVEAVHRRKDGHIFPIEYSTTLIKVGERELVLGIDRDITGRKQAEEALRQAKEAAEESRRAAEAASRAKSEFLSRMSHELRTPMNAILGFAQLLEMSRKEPLTSTQRERVKQIVKGGQHLLDLINEILDISRIEANRLQMSPEPVSVRESIQEALDLTVPLAIKRQIQIVTRLGRMEDQPFVLADRQRFKQVLLNLLGNAVKYNFDGGSVIISCEQVPSNRWRLSVADTGPGISQENLARLFIPFERLGANPPNVEGTGLGLVLAKRLVELMKGRIGVESAPGRGSTFWIELPAAESPVERLQRIGGTGGLPLLSTVGRTILYVEDNVANFELIRQVLADYSQIELLWAADIKTGMERVSDRHLDLLLLDVHLAGMDGAEILQRLKQDKETAGVPVVVISADATPGQIERLLACGAHAYLTKPLDVKRFIRLIEELLGEKEF